MTAGSGVLSRITTLAAFVAAWVLTFSLAFWAMSQPVSAQAVPPTRVSPNGDLAPNREDLDFILKQIKIAERHVAGEELADILPNSSLPWGLRTVDGKFNNLIPGQENFGRADEPFPTATDRLFPSAQTLTEDLNDDGSGINEPTTYDSGTAVQDSTPRLISQLIVNQTTANPAATATASAEDGEEIGVDISGYNGYFIPNTAPDEGLSAPYNAFITFFGQFFDHGLDLINKGGNSVVYMPLQPDDPLYVEGGDMNFMVMTRATRMPGEDGVLGTEDDLASFINATTPHVDQQQTYGSHGSAQVLLRHYTVVDGVLQNSGRLLNGYGVDEILDTADDGGMATWDTAQAQARDKFGIELDDHDGNNIPMFAVDFYGKFVPGPDRGLPMLVVRNGDGSLSEVEGNLVTPVDASQAIRVNHSFFLDVAHSANPGGKLADDNDVINPRTDDLAGQMIRGIRENAPEGRYDDELLGRHFICGDGRCNENIALTTVHHVFHSEHNRLTDVTKRVVLDSRDLDFLNEWLLSPLEALPAPLALSFDVDNASLANQATAHNAIEALGLHWNGERIFQTARFGTEMQYNRVVFDEFGPTLAGLKDPFEGFHTDVDPSITAEFSQSVYRFGHSMLTETVDRYDPDFEPLTDLHTGTNTQLGLFEAFLNPLAWNNSDSDGVPTLTPEEAAGSIVRGLTRTTGNELDEFITGAMQSNLVGMPLDIGAINIARGRDVGNPPLNVARKMFFAATGDHRLNPYAHWVDYTDNLRHEESLVNFIAAYGKHPTLAGDDGIVGNDDDPNQTFDARRAAACAIVAALNPDFCADSGFGESAQPADAMDFLFSRNAWATPADGVSRTGVDDIDFWNGGLAEERMPFGGYLGSTHNFVFEKQLENLQNGDRFYYVGRTANINFFSELESNSFTALVMRNTDLGEPGAGTMALNIFSIPNHVLEVDQSQQFNKEQADQVAEAAEAVAAAQEALDAAIAAQGGNNPDPVLAQAVADAQIALDAAIGAAALLQDAAELLAIDSLVAQNELARLQSDTAAGRVIATAIVRSNGSIRIRADGLSAPGNFSVEGMDADDCDIQNNGNFNCSANDLVPGSVVTIIDTAGGDPDQAEIDAATLAVQAADAAAAAAAMAAGDAAAEQVRASVALAIAVAELANVMDPDLAGAQAALDEALAFQAEATGPNADPTGDAALIPLIIRDAASVTTNITIPDPSRVVQYTGGDHVIIGGTEGDDTIIGGIGDDSLWGRGGNDRIEGGDGADHIEGGTGDDILTDLSGPDVIEGGAGHDAIHSGNEEDVIFGDDGNDFIINGSEFGEIFSGEGNDYILDGTFLGHSRGGGGDDWIENLGGGEDLFQGDHGTAAEAGESPTKGHDVFIGWAGNNDADMENGDDIVVDGPGIDRVEGQLGFDWVSFAYDESGVNIDLDLTIFLRPQLPPSNNTIANRYDRVEGASGSPMGDILRGTSNLPGEDSGNELVNFDLIDGLGDLVPDIERRDLPNDPVTGAPQFGWTGGDILLGGGASDILVGEGGDDILDGDASLKVNIATPDPAIRTGPLGQAFALARSEARAVGAQAGVDADIAAGAADDLALAIAAVATASADSAAKTIQAAPTAAAASQAATAAAIAKAAADAAARDVVAMDPTASMAASDALIALIDANASAAVAADLTAVAAAVQAVADAAQAASAAALADFSAMGATTLAEVSEAAVAAAIATAESFMADMERDAALAVAAADQAVSVAAAAAALAAAADAVITDNGPGGALELALAASDAASAATAALASAGSSQAVANFAAITLAEAEAALVAAQAASDTANAIAAASAVAAGPAQDALADAAADLAAADQTVLVKRMSDVQGAIFAGFINPGELAISRVISDDDAANEATDAAQFNGNFEDYTIERDPTVAVDSSDPANGIGDFDEDGFIQVLDNRAVPHADGRDLLRGIERLAFDDQTVVIDPRRNEVPPSHNRVAVGAATVAGSHDLGEVLTASADDVSDADNVSSGGSIASFIDWEWQIELEPGSGLFEAINRIVGVNGNGDPFPIRGAEMTVTIEELGREVRVSGLFQDEAGVFERIVSPSTRVRVPMGFIFPPGLAGLIPPIATFNAPGACPVLGGLDIIAENVSRIGRPRIDFTIVGADLADFTGADSAFGAGFDAAAELAVSNIGLTFEDDLTGDINAELTPEIVAQEDPLNPGELLSDNRVDILWSIRGGDVAPLVSGPTTASFSVDTGGMRCTFASINLSGNSAVASGTAVTIDFVNGVVPVDPELLGIPVANFLGNAGDIDGDAIGFENNSRARAGGARFDVAIPNLDLALFDNHGFGDPILGGDEILTDSFQINFVDSSGMLTGSFPAEIAAITDPVDGSVDQNSVDVLFSIRGVAVDPLVRGTTSVMVSVDGIGLTEFNLFGDSSVAEATDVIVLVTAAQLAAAEALDAALAGGDQAAIDAAVAAFEEENMAAASAVTEAQLAAELALEPRATFTGDAGDIAIEDITFENASKPDLARLDITIPRVRLNRFANHGFPSPITAEDEIAVEGISLTFAGGLGGPVTGIFAPEIVASVNLNTGAVRQNRVDVLFSIRGADVAPLVNGTTEVILSLGNVPIATINLFGDSSVDDAQDVVVLSNPAEFSAAFALDVANVMGGTARIALAEANLSRAMAFSSSGPGGPVAQALSVAPVTEDINIVPMTQPTVVDPVPAPEVTVTHPDFPASGKVDNRGRIRIQGHCNPGGIAVALPLNCRSRHDGTFDCRGRALTPGLEVNVTCSGGEPAIADLLVGATGTADKRGQLRISGACEIGEAWSPKLSCSTRVKGTFRCSATGRLNPKEEAVVYCR